MYLPADIFLALRYLKPKRTFVSVITLLSILGPILGVAVLLIVNSVMAGFDKDIRQGIMDLQAHVQVYPVYTETIATPVALSEKLEQLGVKAAALIEGSVLVQVRESISPKVVRGIDTSTEHKVSNLSKSIITGRYELSEGGALIGDRLASQLQLDLGDTMLLHSPGKLTRNVKWKQDGSVDITQPDEVYLPEQVKITGIYAMGVADFDENIIFLHIDQAADLYGYDWDSATAIQCRVPDPMNMDALVNRMRDAFPNMQCVTWQERNQMLFGTLRVEKNLMTFLMAFIVLVASFSIAATLITVVVQKTREIGVLKAVGMSRFMIARIFLLQGSVIGVIGTAIGTCLGLLVIFFREKIGDFLSFLMGHDVFPPELYHLRKIPALVTPGDLAFIVILSLAICIFAAVIPAIYASSLAPARALQEEQ